MKINKEQVGKLVVQLNEMAADSIGFEAAVAITVLLQEREELKEDASNAWTKLGEQCIAHDKTIQQLAAAQEELAEIKGQEPVCEIESSGTFFGSVRKFAGRFDALPIGTKLFARPVALAQVPDGWKLVPVEPTTEMIVAGELSGSGCDDVWTPSEHCYRAMLSAAPTPEKK